MTNSTYPSSRKKPDVNFKFDDNLKDLDLSAFDGVDFSDPSSMDPSMMDKLKAKFSNFKFGGKDDKTEEVKEEEADTDSDDEKKIDENAENEEKSDADSEKSAENENEPENKEEKKEESENQDSTDKNDEGAEKAETEKEPEKPAEPKYKKVKSSVTLGSTHEFVNLINTNEEKIKAQVALLTMLENRELEKRQREEALNKLESLIYDKQDKLYAEGGYAETVSEEDREKFSAALSAASDFIWDVEEPTAKIYNDKTDELTEMMKEWVARAEEMKVRPKLLKDLEDHFNMTKSFLTAIKKTHSEQPEDDRTFTDKEIETLEEKYNEIVDWKNSTVKKQEELSPLEEPVITVKIVAEKSKALDREASYLAKKAKSWRPKPKKEEKKEDEAKDEEKKEEKAEKNNEKEENQEQKSEEKASENEEPTNEESTENQEDQKSEENTEKDEKPSHEEL